jgi:molybdate transport system substrate-binding protein
LLRRFVDRRLLAVLGALILAIGLVACGGSDDSDSGDGGDLTVFAAASLTEAFSDLGKQYEAEHDGAKVKFNFASSSDLAAQIDQGAPADVFASADEPNMQKVVDADMTDGDPEAFAGTVLEIAVPKGNPGNVKSLDDLSREDLLVAICDVEAPCGNAATEVLGKAGVDASIDSYEADVKSVLTKVELGEVDAGLVYHSDVLAAGDKIDSIRIPERDQVINVYPIAVVKGAGNPEGGQDFIDLVRGDDGQAELAKWGFRAP